MDEGALQEQGRLGSRGLSEVIIIFEGSFDMNYS